MILRLGRIARLVAGSALCATLVIAQGNGNGNGNGNTGNNGNGNGNAYGQSDDKETKGPEFELNPFGLANTGQAVTVGSTGVITPKITYHGGALMGTPIINIIWYGNWNQGNGSDNSAGQQIIRDLAYGLQASDYMSINASYSTGASTISGAAIYNGLASETTDNYSQGKNLSDTAIRTIVRNAISSQRLHYDLNAVYFVLTSSDVNVTSGFCSRYCGWHTTGTDSSGRRIRYSFVGNANRCLSGCAAQSKSPNNNPGVDGMASVLAHELVEAGSDPDLNAWYDSRGYENADKCAWTFGPNQAQAANGSWYNLTLNAQYGGTRNFLIQRNLKQITSGDLCLTGWTRQ